MEKYCWGDVDILRRGSAGFRRQLRNISILKHVLSLKHIPKYEERIVCLKAASLSFSLKDILIKSTQSKLSDGLRVCYKVGYRDTLYFKWWRTEDLWSLC